MPNLDGLTIRNTGGGNLVGGSDPAARNLISGNTNFGVTINNDGNRLLNNFVGVGLDGSSNLGNGRTGISINSQSNTAIENSVIAYNGEDGIAVNYFRSGTANAFLGNSIFGNAQLGIDLGNDGPTANDIGDADTGANDLQNFPIIEKATVGTEGGSSIQGRLNSTPNTTFRVEFFATDGSGAGQGRVFLGFQDVTTDANGNAVLRTTVPAALQEGQFVTATATNAVSGTSEFSFAEPVSGQPPELVLTVTDGVNSTTPGGTLSYTLTYRNNSAQTATNVVLTERVPAGTAFNAAASTPGWMETSSGSGVYRLPSAPYRVKARARRSSA
jgi:uncharacterized repeat protein (TIGR01451 family)